MDVVVVMGVVEAGIVKVVGEARVRGRRLYFLGLPLPHLEPDPRPVISDL